MSGDFYIFFSFCHFSYMYTRNCIPFPGQKMKFEGEKHRSGKPETSETPIVIIRVRYRINTIVCFQVDSSFPCPPPMRSAGGADRWDPEGVRRPARKSARGGASSPGGAQGAPGAPAPGQDARRGAKQARARDRGADGEDRAGGGEGGGDSEGEPRPQAKGGCGDRIRCDPVELQDA